MKRRIRITDREKTKFGISKDNNKLQYRKPAVLHEVEFSTFSMNCKLTQDMCTHYPALNQS